MLIFAQLIRNIVLRDHLFHPTARKIFFMSDTCFVFNLLLSVGTFLG